MTLPAAPVHRWPARNKHSVVARWKAELAAYVLIAFYRADDVGGRIVVDNTVRGLLSDSATVIT